MGLLWKIFKIFYRDFSFGKHVISKGKEIGLLTLWHK
jgi:hypothetical protein